MTITVNKLSLKKTKARILQSISVDIPKHQFTAIMGPNGAGKTSLLKCLVQADTTYEGQVFITGKDIRSLTSQQRSQLISWVPEDTSIPFAFTATEVVLLGRFPIHQGCPQAADYTHALKALKQVGLESKADQAVTSMSSGERRKVMIARAISSECKYLFLDEPVANLDVLATLETMTLLRQLSRKHLTVIISLHDLSLAKRYCDHVTILSKSKLSANGPVSSTLSPKLISEIFHVRAETLIDRSGQESIVVDLEP